MPIPGLTGLNSIQVLLDDGTGTFPYDISRYARLPESMQWTRGRADELQQIQPGSLTLTLDNTDGRFSFGNVTYNVAPDQKIRFRINSTTRWTGLVQSWPVSWPHGGQEFATVVVTAIDPLATMARRTLRSALEETILARSPSAYYTLGEATGATQAADSSGNSASSLVATWTGAAFTFGSGTGPGADGLTAATFAGGQYLIFPATSAAAAVECFFTTTSTPPSGGALDLAPLMSSGATALGVGTDGKLHTDPIGFDLTGPVVTDGRVHHAVWQTGHVYLDGVDIGSPASPFVGTGGGRLGVGGSTRSVGGALQSVFTGSISHFALHPSPLSSSDVTAIYNAGKTNLTGESPQARLTRVAGSSGVTVGALDTASTAACGPASQSGKSAGDVVNEVADATQGIVYADKNGAISSVSGYSIAQAVTPVLTIDASYVAPDTAVAVDMLQVVNRLTGQANGSANLTFAQNAASIGSPGNHGVYDPGSKSWNVSTDAQAADLTNWIVGNYATPDARFPTLVLDLLTLDLATVTAALTLDLGGFLRVTGMPSQTPGSTTLDLIVQSVTETVSLTEWTLAVTCAKRTRYSGWVLGDATYGVLGSTTRLTAA